MSSNEQVLSMSLRSLDLNKACRRKLRENGIETVGDLISRTRSRLGGYERDRLNGLAEWHLGVRSLDRIEMALLSRGLKLSEEPSRK